MGCTAVYGISQESAGKVWFADASDLISFDPVAEEFIEYTGLGCAAQFPFIDGSGNIWTSQGGGGLVCRFPPP
jgi:streptogramin lyase